MSVKRDGVAAQHDEARTSFVKLDHLFDPVTQQLIELTPDPRRDRPLSRG